MCNSIRLEPNLNEIKIELLLLLHFSKVKVKKEKEKFGWHKRSCKGGNTTLDFVNIHSGDIWRVGKRENFLACNAHNCAVKKKRDILLITQPKELDVTRIYRLHGQLDVQPPTLPYWAKGLSLNITPFPTCVCRARDVNVKRGGTRRSRSQSFSFFLFFIHSFIHFPIKIRSFLPPPFFPCIYIHPISIYLFKYIVFY